MTFLLLALLAALPQADPPAREKASGFTFVRPKGWSLNKLDNGAVALQPPGNDALQCSLFIFPGQDNAELGEQAFHDKMFESLTASSKVDGPVDRTIKGAWRMSSVRIITAQEQPSWLGVYSTKSGPRLEILMLVARTEKLFTMHRPVVEGMIASVEFPAAKPALAGAAIHGLVIPIPRDWIRKDDPSGGVHLIPPQIPGVLQYFLFVLPPTKLEGAPWVTHKALLKGILDQVKWVAGDPVIAHKVEGPGPFVKSEIAGKTVAGEFRQFTFYSAAHDGVLEAILGVNSLDRNVTDPVLQATTFKDPPKADPRPKIVEAYRRINQRLYNTRDGGALVAGSLMYDRIWLLSNGVVDTSTFYSEGYAASTLPLKVDSSLQNGDFGSWKAVGDTIHITRNAGGKAEVYERHAGGLRGGGKDWEPMPRVDGLKLSGRWEIKSPPEEKIAPYHDWIEFTPEGRFKVEGVLKSLTVGDVSPYRAPAKASGTYDIRDWTMFFKFDDGTTWSTDFSILGREIKPDLSILFRTSVFLKGK